MNKSKILIILFFALFTLELVIVLISTLAPLRTSATNAAAVILITAILIVLFFYLRPPFRSIPPPKPMDNASVDYN